MTTGTPEAPGAFQVQQMLVMGSGRGGPALGLSVKVTDVAGEPHVGTESASGPHFEELPS